LQAGFLSGGPLCEREWDQETARSKAGKTRLEEDAL
jgi:hypothetical protein